MQDKNIMISVIIPVYNVEKYLDRCIGSVLSQSFQDFEIIIVDDGSNDGCGEKCDIWKSKSDKIQVIHQYNQGLSAARNAGIKIAQGEYLSFVDSDDWLEPDMLLNMIDAAMTNGADIVLCRGQFVEEDNRVSKIVGYDTTKIMSRGEATKEILKDEDIPSFAWNKIYRKKLFDGIEYPVGRIFEDTATTYKLFYKTQKVVAIPFIGYNYRMNADSITHQKRCDIQKFIKRDLDNALAFDERYLFACSHYEFNDVVPLCAFKAYLMIRSFIHLCVHKKFRLTDEQSKCVEDILSTMEIKHLSMFSMYQKTDLILYKINKNLLWLYLKIIAIIRPLEFEIK